MGNKSHSKSIFIEGTFLTCERICDRKQCTTRESPPKTVVRLFIKVSLSSLITSEVEGTCKNINKFVTIWILSNCMMEQPYPVGWLIVKSDFHIE